MKAALFAFVCFFVAVTEARTFLASNPTEVTNPFGFTKPEGELPEIAGEWKFERWTAGVDTTAPPNFVGVATFTLTLSTSIVDQYRSTHPLADAEKQSVLLVSVKLTDNEDESYVMEGYVNHCKATYMIDGPWMFMEARFPMTAGYLLYTLDSRTPLIYSGAYSLKMGGNKGTDRLTKIA